MFSGVKVFSATRARDRDELGVAVSRWLKANADLRVVDQVVLQSSDAAYHCVSVVIFYDLPRAAEDRRASAG